MIIVLIGYRGSGKTSVGRAVADRLGYRFVDLDTVIVARAGRSIRDIFDRHGEPHFRALESACLSEALQADDLVLSPGGGVVLSEANRAMIRASATHVIYLHADADVLHRRISADPATAEQRPALSKQTNLAAEIREVLAKRLPIYRGVMTGEVDAGVGVKAVVDRVVGVVQS